MSKQKKYVYYDFFTVMMIHRASGTHTANLLQMSMRSNDAHIDDKLRNGFRIVDLCD